MIIVPPFSWFKEGNGYTGSSGTDPEKGSLCVKTFHFCLAVVTDAYPESFKLALHDNLLLALGLHEDALFTQADAPKCLSRTEETRIAVARNGE